MVPRLVIPPATMPVEVKDIKEIASVDFADDDDTIASHILAATGLLDGYSGLLGRCLISQTWSITFAGWQDVFTLPFPSVSSARVFYRDLNGATRELLQADFEVVPMYGRDQLILLTANRPPLFIHTFMPVRIELVAGYGVASDVPEPIKQAIRFMVASWYDDAGEEVGQIPDAVFRMVSTFRCLT